MHSAPRSLCTRLLETLRVYASLAVLTFGGQNAAIALYYQIFVVKRKWISEAVFLELFGVCQGLPGPGSAELSFAISLIRNGIVAAVFSFFVWATPAAIVLFVGALGISHTGGTLPAWLSSLENGFVSAATGLVALASYRLSTKIIETELQRFICLSTIVLSICWTAPYALPALMVAGGLLAVIAEYGGKRKVQQLRVLFRERGKPIQEEKHVEEIVIGQDAIAPSISVSDSSPRRRSSIASITPSLTETVRENIETHADATLILPYSRRAGLFLLGTWLVLFLLAILVKTTIVLPKIGEVFFTMYLIGGITFGGGPVLIPLMQQYVVSSGWLSDQELLLGFALVNALPGPTFNFSVYVGALALRDESPILGAIISWIGLFLPGMLLVSGLLPFWNSLRRRRIVRVVFDGVTAGACGLVFQGTYILWQKAVSGKSAGSAVGGYPLYVSIVVACFVVVGFWKWPPVLGIGLGGAVGIIEWVIEKYA